MQITLRELSEAVQLKFKHTQLYANGIYEKLNKPMLCIDYCLCLIILFMARLLPERTASGSLKGLKKAL